MFTYTLRMRAMKTYPETEECVSIFPPALGEQGVPLVRLPTQVEVHRLHALTLAPEPFAFGARALVITEHFLHFHLFHLGHCIGSFNIYINLGILLLCTNN